MGHSAGQPASDEPAEIIAEALVFAGANGRMDVVDYLVAGGADIDARPYLNTTALHLPILFANPDAVAGLIERGASPYILDAHHNSDAAGWAQACLRDANPATHQIAELLSP